jgi:hypothetical protein
MGIPPSDGTTCTPPSEPEPDPVELEPPPPEEPALVAGAPEKLSPPVLC